MKGRSTFLALGIPGAAMLAEGRARATCCRSAADCPAGFASLGGACDASLTERTCDADCGPNLPCQITGVNLCVQVPGGAVECHPHNQCLATVVDPTVDAAALLTAGPPSQPTAQGC